MVSRVSHPPFEQPGTLDILNGYNFRICARTILQQLLLPVMNYEVV